MFGGVWSRRFSKALPVSIPKKNYIQNSIDLILQDKALQRYCWQPGTQKMLETCEHELEINLPQSFKEYVLTIGNVNEQMIFGRDAEMGFLTDILSPEPWEPEDVSEYEAFVAKLKNYPALCFSSHEGYAYDWFYLVPGDEDPQCYFTQNFETIECKGRFSEYLFNSLMGFSNLLS